jgi:phycocyanin-associated rod linker protein
VAITTAASRLGTSAFSDAPRIELRPNYTQADVETVIAAVYRQVLGNDHLMKSERLIGAESLLRKGESTYKTLCAVLPNRSCTNPSFSTAVSKPD